MMEISIKQKLLEIAEESEKGAIDSMFFAMWEDLDSFDKERLYELAEKLIEEQRMTYAVSQLLQVGMDIEDAELIEELIRDGADIPFQDDWSNEIKLKIQELINRHAQGQRILNGC